MRRLLFILPLLLLPFTAFAAACDPKECSGRSGLSSELFCKNDDVYAVFLEYYCSGDECVSQPVDRLVEQCSMGCTIGSCTECDESACKAKSDYVSESFCTGNDVYRVYHNYFCEFQKGCTFDESEKLIEQCKEDLKCNRGKCGGCELADCDALDGFAGEDFCGLDRNIYRQFRDYSCGINACTFSSQDVKIAGCDYSCEEGRCTLPACDPGCEKKDTFVGDTYCKGSSVFRKFRDYSCGSIKCEFNETEKKIEDCKKCMDGKCVITKSINERLIEFGVQFSNETAERNITAPPQRVYNGLFFGGSGMALGTNAFVKSVSFTVLNTNGLGELSVFADRERIFSTKKEGIVGVTIGRKSGHITISTSSSGFVFWMPAVYDMGTVTATLVEDKIRRNEFSFTLAKAELDSFKSAEIVAWPASTSILLNGRVLENNAVPKSQLQIQNKIEFVALINETFARKTVMMVAYEK